jgi:peptidoglycan/LPS O-acetylase OafA/YrhL
MGEAMPAAAHSKINALYRPDIDGLRAVAILGVVAYHLGLPFISGGFTGVDVFFVISGYLITQLLVRQIAKTGRLSLTEFYARRMRRLLPALSVVILTTLIFGAFLVPPTGDRRQLAESALSALAFVANQYFLTHTLGYFDGPSELKPLLHLWSLSVEEQFYIIWPIALILVTRLALHSDRVLWFRITIAVITMLSFSLSVWLVQTNMSAAFFISPSRAWELGIGALLSLWTPRLGESSAPVGRAASWAGTALIAGAYTLIEPSTAFPGKAALLPVLGTGLLIFGNTLAPASLPARLLTSKPMVSIGALSYAWYLWHWPLISFARTQRLMAPNMLVDTAFALAALGLAAFTLRFVENPIRYGTALRGRTNAAVVRLGATAIMLVAAVAAAVFLWDVHGPKSVRDQLALQVAQDRPGAQFERCLFSREEPLHHLATGDCRFGDSMPAISLALWGDSHAMAWAPMLSSLQTNGGPVFKLYSMASCQPLLGSPAPGMPHDFCAEFNENTYREIITLKAQGLQGVVLSGRWVTLRHPSISRYDTPPEHAGIRSFIRQIRSKRVHSNVAPTDMLATGLAATARALTESGLRVLILLDPPEERQPIPACVFVHFPDIARCGISRAEYDQYTSDVRKTVSDLPARFPGVRVIDPTNQFCDETQCPPFFQGSPTLFDDDHISSSAARSLAPAYQPYIHWLLRQ